MPTHRFHLRTLTHTQWQPLGGFNAQGDASDTDVSEYDDCHKEFIYEPKAVGSSLTGNLHVSKSSQCFLDVPMV